MFVVSVSLSKSVPRDADAVIVGLTQVSGTPALVDLPSSLEKDLTKRWGTSPLAVALDLGAKTKSGSTVVLPTAGVRLVVVGLGDVDVTPEQVRRAVGNGVKALARLEPASPLHVVVSLDLVEPEVIKGAAEGALLGAYTYTKIGSEPSELLRLVTLVSPSTKPEAKDAVAAAVAIAAGVNQTRDWINTPANILYPETFAADTVATSKKHKLEVEVLDEKALAKAGFGGILAVGMGSERPPRLVRAAEDKPDLIVDVATLTGACVVALGERTAGLIASDDQTADRLLDAAEAAGEAFWQLPITDEVQDQLTSKVADLKSGGARWGGALTAGAFLQRFTDGIDWAHLDIAGPAFNEKEPYDYVPSGGTGVAVRTLVALAQSLQG